VIRRCIGRPAITRRVYGKAATCPGAFELTEMRMRLRSAGSPGTVSKDAGYRRRGVACKVVQCGAEID
jgi:hypothetical protein